MSRTKRVWLGGLSCVVVFLAAVLVWATSFALWSVQAVRANHFANTQKYAQRALPAWNLLSFVTFSHIPDIEVAKLGVKILADSKELETLSNNLPKDLAANTFSLTPIQQLVSRQHVTLSKLADEIPHTVIFPRLLGQEKTKTLHSIVAGMPDILEALSLLSTGTHKYIAILQNSDELRATGGFMGSYAVLEIENGSLVTFVIEDIYDADGQFQGYVPAPAGVKEYLSSNNGLRLPDANWDPHFPKSAEHILQFFALGSRQDVDGIIAVNDHVFKSVLDLTGPVWLPDYQTSVTSQNLTTVLRAEREDFFAGSIQKKHLLAQFKNQLVSQLAASPPSATELLELLKNETSQKNILVYSHSQPLQELAQKYHLDGSLFSNTSSPGLALVESNVGINKANKGVTRSVDIKKQGDTLAVTLTFTNTNKPPLATNLQAFVTPDFIKTASASATHLAYVNYQRALYPATWELTSISVGESTLETWNQEEYILEQDNNVKLTQVGFLIPVREKSSEVATLTFKLPTADEIKSLELYRQPGIISPEVTISWDETNNTFLLESNHVTMLP